MNYSKLYSINLYFIFISFSIIIINCEYLNNDDKLINEYVVQVPGGYSEAVSVASQTGFRVDHKMIGFDDLFVFKRKTNENKPNHFIEHRVKRNNKVTYIEQQVARKRIRKAPLHNSTPMLFSDPLYSNQWYLMRSQIDPNKYDMNVIEAWNLGFSGRNVVVCILDDGIDYRHPDLKDNYDQMASYDINGGDYDPLPNYHITDNRHGTRCAGEVAAKSNNTHCGVGIAFNSKIGAVRMLDGDVTDRVEAEALSLRQQHIDIYSGSWGPDDNGQRVEGPARLAKAAFEKGVKYGRNGLGNIYVWASGNGGSKDDSCACDGYASSIFTLSVSSVSELNLRPWYLEACASTLVSTYSSGGLNEKKIISTDLNFQCALDHTGTSASAPLAAGIIALLLEANRKLTWRDVQYITVVTANPAPFVDGDFIINGANRKVSNLYGFGLMDTGKMVRLGALWQTLPPQHKCKSILKLINRPLYGSFVEKVYLDIDGCVGDNMVNYVEHVILYLSIEYQKRGDLQVALTSPAGTRSVILPFRSYDMHSGNATFDIWPLMSVQFWGERSSGKWILEVRNTASDSSTLKGILLSFSLEIYGTDKWPMRLRAPKTLENDMWFQKFERYVVADRNDVFPLNLTYFRGHADTSNNAFAKADIKCHDECFNNTCNGWGPNYCITCKTYQTYDGVCVKQCPAGTYLNTSGLICEPCDFSCDECVGAGKFNCSKCHTGDSFDSMHKQCGISVKGCPEEFFKDSSTCVKCPGNCSVCGSLTQCSQCKIGFVLTLNSQCKEICDLGSYPDKRRRCRVCHIDCLSCINGNSNECTSCKQGFLILPTYNDYAYGKCISECLPGYFTNHTSGVCYRCHQNCKTCTGTSSASCTDCIPPLELSETGHTCIDPVSYNCKPGEFKSEIGICVKCPTQCKTCTNGRCTSCYSYRRFLHNNICTEICPDGYFSFSKDNMCLSCKSFCDPCHKRNNLTGCDQCTQSIEYCQNNCKYGEYWNGLNKTCNKCHISCSSCNAGSSRDCLTCSQTDYYLSSGKCIKECHEGQRPFVTSERKLCIPCYPSCNNATCDRNTGKCLRCAPGHFLTKEGYCERIITCPIWYFWEAIEDSCKFCNMSCRSCSMYGPCTSCNMNYCLHPSFGSCHPCCSPFSTIKNCFECRAGREFCYHLHLTQLPSQLLIFRFPISVLFSIFLSILFLFTIIILFFYRKEIMKKKLFIDSAIQYTTLKENHEHDEINESFSEDLSDNESVLFRDSNKTYKLLSNTSFVDEINLKTKTTTAIIGNGTNENINN